MKKALIIIAALFGSFFIFKLGLAFGGFAFLLSSFTIAMIIHLWGQAQTLKRYAKMYNNLYIVSRHPETGDELALKSLAQYAIHADFSKVIEEVETQKDLLVKANNPFFVPDLTKNQKLQVIPLIFQSGEHVTESWKEYRKRVVHVIKADLSNRHQYLKKQDEKWYLKHSDSQVLS